MKQEYVLPKFRIPGQANWLVRGVWFIAGVVTLSLGALGLAYWRRSAQAPVAVVAPAPSPVAPAAPPVAARPGAPATAVPAPARPLGAPGAPATGKLAANKRPAGARFGRYRGRGWGKGKIGARARGGKRGLAARRAYLKKKRLLAARRANAGWPAKPAAGSGGLSPQRGRAPTGATANRAKGDPIDDILKNFK
jgi:hypothetical protein